MKLIIIIIICSIILFISFDETFFENVSKKINYRNLEQILIRNIQEISQYDSYMILYFKEDCNYSEGFKNNNRKNISFIINRENGHELTSEETLNIHKGFGIEIHFNFPIRSLQFFFDRNTDNNIKYLKSINFDNFDTSLVTNMEKMFYGCTSLISISFTNFHTANEWCFL